MAVVTQERADAVERAYDDTHGRWLASCDRFIETQKETERAAAAWSKAAAEYTTAMSDQAVAAAEMQEAHEAHQLAARARRELHEDVRQAVKPSRFDALLRRG